MTDAELKKLAEAATQRVKLITFSKPKYTEQIVAATTGEGMNVVLFDAVDHVVQDDSMAERRRVFHSGEAQRWAEQFVKRFNEAADELAAKDAEIAALRAKVKRLEDALRLRDADRRQWFLSDLIATKGHFNRKDLCEQFKISVPQASSDIKRFISQFPELTIYNKSLKRYDLRRAAQEAGK